MEQETSAPKLPLDEIHARMGLTITEEGKARARRRRLASAAAHRDSGAREAFLAQLRSRTA